MKRLALYSALISMLAFSALGQKAAAAKADPSKGVRDAFDRLIEGIKQVDAAKVMSVYEKNDRVLFFNNNGSATIGWDNMKSNRESSYVKTKDVTLDITGLRVEMLGKTRRVCFVQMETITGLRRKVGERVGTNDARISFDRQGLEGCSPPHFA